MATETLTISLTSSTSKISGKDIVTEENDTQIVTITDGGNIDGRTFTFEFWGKDTATNAGEGPGGDDLFKIDLATFNDDFTILVKSMTPGDEFWISNFDTWTTVGSVHTFTYTGSDGGNYTFIIDAQSQNSKWGEATVVCFTADTRIATPVGERPIGALAVGDMVLCGDGVARPIHWIGQRVLSCEELAARPDLAPLRIAPGALGAGLPDRPLGLSPQHKVLVTSWQADLMFDSVEVLVPAKAFLVLPGVVQPATDRTVTYYHLLLDGHHTVMANGLPCETLMPATIAQTALDAEARSELFTLLPDLVSDLDSFGPLCHPGLTVAEGRMLLLTMCGPQAAVA